MNKFKDLIKKNVGVLIIVIVSIVILNSFQDKGAGINVPGKPGYTAIPGDWDISEEVKMNGYDIYLVEENDFDFSDPEVYTLAESIKQSTSNPKDAIKKTAELVATNVRYDGSVSISYCYSEKASDVLETGLGDCVSMSRLVTALLRAQGIPARTMGGCLSLSKRCVPLFAVIPGAEPQVTPLIEGDFKKRGFLHEYVEVWEPSEGWSVLEATAGIIFPKDCVSYLDYGYDSNNRNRCVINDASFWQECRAY